MKLEVGKKYVNKMGEVYRITDRFDFEYFPFQGINIETMMTETFQDDGKWRLSGDSLNDLVSEYTPPKEETKN